MGNLLKTIKKYWILILLIIGLVYVQVMADLALPDYMAKIVNEGIVGENSDIITTAGLEMLVVTGIGAVATLIVGYLASIVSTGFARDLRKKVFTKVESFSLKEFNIFSTSSLITRTTNDIQQVQLVTFMVLRLVISAPIMGVGAVIKAFDTAPSISWLIYASISIILIAIVTLLIFAIPKFTAVQKLVDRLNLLARENLTGLRVIRAFTNEDHEEEKFDKTNKELTRLNVIVNRLFTIMQPLMMLVLNLTTIGIIWYGAKSVDLGDLLIGDMMAFIQYAMQVLMSFLMLSMVFIMVPRGAVSMKRINEVIDSDSEIKDPEDSEEYDPEIQGQVEFKNVSFAYKNSDEPVLKDISFKIDKGETVAIIGSTGSGKSTLINLIPRLYDTTDGKVLVDGIDVKKAKQEALHEKLGYIPQKSILFSGSIRSNLRFGQEDVTEDKLVKALEIAQAADFVNDLEKGIDSNVAQGGANFSGGQKQRLSIARAIVRRPEIYIFDDSFSALDFKTDQKLRSALKKNTQGSTLLIVTQRVSTALYADKIIVLNDGELVGLGNHNELLANCKVYQEIAQSQLSEKELETEVNNG